MSRRRDIGTDDPRVKVRPGRSKPRRSKKKVDYSDSPQGFVYALDRGRYHVELEHNPALASVTTDSSAAEAAAVEEVVTEVIAVEPVVVEPIITEAAVTEASPAAPAPVKQAPANQAPANQAPANQAAADLSAADSDTPGQDATSFSPIPGTDAESKTRITCVKARELGRHAIVVGDRVRVNGDLSGRKDTLARLVEVLPRKNELRRSAEDSVGAKEKPMVANVDQLAIVTACADPVPRPGMVDRCLVAAYVTGMKPLLVLTKSDLVSAAPIIDTFAPLGIDYVVTSAERGSGISELSDKLSRKISVLVGHSGVGKSTLINTLIPQAGRKTGHVNQVTGRGRHTSTSSVAFPYQGGWIIDTPGIRSFGLAHIELADIFGAFPDLQEIIEYCPKGCLHHPDSSGCALPRWAKTDPQKQRRLASLYRLILSHHKQYRENLRSQEQEA